MVKFVRYAFIGLIMSAGALADQGITVERMVDTSLMIQSRVSGATVGQLLEAFKANDATSVYWNSVELRDRRVEVNGPAWAGDIMQAVFESNNINAIDFGEGKFFVFEGVPPYIPGHTSKLARPAGVSEFVIAPGSLSNIVRMVALEYSLSPLTEIDLDGWATSEPVKFRGDNLLSDIGVLERLLSSVFSEDVTIDHYVDQSVLVVKSLISSTASSTDPAIRGCYNSIDFKQDVDVIREGISICNGGAVTVY